MPKFISIDPGLNFCGISVIESEKLTEDTATFKVLETILVKNARKFTETEKSLEKRLDARTVKVLSIIDTIRGLLERYEIEAIVIEAPFYNALTPMTYGSLLEVIFGIKYSLVINSELNFHLIEPLRIKKIFTNFSQANKEQMATFLRNKKESGDIEIDKNIEELSEHEVDSIAVGFVYVLDGNNGG